MLNGYIQYISRIVEQETMQNIRDQLILRTKTVQQQLEPGSGPSDKYP